MNPLLRCQQGLHYCIKANQRATEDPIKYMFLPQSMSRRLLHQTNCPNKPTSNTWKHTFIKNMASGALLEIPSVVNSIARGPRPLDDV